MSSPARPSASTQPRLDGATSLIHGRYLWHQFHALDVDKALEFYHEVCGWTVSTMDVPGGSDRYTTFSRGDTGIGGVMPIPAEQARAGAEARWVSYIGSDDAATTCRDAIALGGTQLGPLTDIPTIGKMAVLADPEGAEFAVITPYPAGTPEQAPVEGDFAWHEMAADDPEASFTFYERLFGWERKHAMDMGSDGVYQMYGRGPFTYGGFMRRSTGMPPAAWNCYVRVPDLDASLEKLQLLGGRVLIGTHEVPNDDRILIAVDNQDAVISLVGKVKR